MAGAVEGAVIDVHDRWGGAANGGIIAGGGFIRAIVLRGRRKLPLAQRRHNGQQQAAFDFTKLNKLLGEDFRHIAGDREANADAAAARGQNSGIDTNQLAVEVQQRAAGVAAVD